MWDEKQKSMMFQGESMNPGFASPEISFIKNTNPVPSNNGSDMHFLEASRKRKAVDLDQGDSVHNDASLGYIGNFRGNLHYLPPIDSSMLHVIAATPMVDSHRRTENFPNQNLQSAKPICVQSQFGNCHFHNTDSASMILLTKGAQFQETASDSSKSCTFYHQESFLSFRTPTEELPKPKLTDSKQDGVATQSESSKVQSYFSQVGRCMEKSQASFRSHIGMNMRHGNYDVSNKSYRCSMISQDLPLLESSRFQMAEKNLNVDGGSNVQDFTKFGLLEAKKGDQKKEFVEGEKSCGSYHKPNTNVNYGNHPCNDSLGVYLDVVPAESSSSEKVCLNYERLKNSAYVSMDSENRSLEKDDCTETEKKDHSMEEGKRSVEHGDNLDEQIKSAAGKVPPATEKLWDGSLQLNASITVSAVAFFKRFLNFTCKLEFFCAFMSLLNMLV
ncbi:hypothetical protein COCNU_01G018490 [Cocos nucifera]|uniref:Uncharacterized protein n=1 Tax=Cocos nucifera TaxID=13894 RepID=A0A8K0HWM7_COCNU|nr:hypothetical protein COCNU_01G018490 [Cocos nucifera]